MTRVGKLFNERLIFEVPVDLMEFTLQGGSLDGQRDGYQVSYEIRLEPGDISSFTFVDVPLMSKVEGRPAVLDHWVEQSGGDMLALLVRGSHSVRWAWVARTGAQAKYVSVQQAISFHDRLKLAEDDLKKVTALDPQNPIPWQLLVTTARGLNGDKEATRQRFTAMIERYPLFSGYIWGTSSTCAKSGTAPMRRCGPMPIRFFKELARVAFARGVSECCARNLRGPFDKG